MARHQRGWLRKEMRKAGPTWVLRFYATRQADGKRVENTLALGLVSEIGNSKSAAWAYVEQQRIHEQINKTDFRGKVTFNDIARHYVEHELGDQMEAVKPKSVTTITRAKSIINNHLLPRWGKHVATAIEPLAVEQWLRSLKRDQHLENTTLHKMRSVLTLIYRHAQRYGLIPRSEEANPIALVRCASTTDYEAMIITPEQAWKIILEIPADRQLERTLTFLVAATGLRISEALGLQWGDADFQHSQIHIRRRWAGGEVGRPKTKDSKAVVPMHEILATEMRSWHAETPYPQPTDWVFPSFRAKGKQPRLAGMLIKDVLRPAAVRAGVVTANDGRQFGFHNLRHSLASFLVRAKHDPKLVQSLLRHSNVHTTLQIYSHVIREDRLQAQGEFLNNLIGRGSTAVQ